MGASPAWACRPSFAHALCPGSSDTPRWKRGPLPPLPEPGPRPPPPALLQLPWPGGGWSGSQARRRGTRSLGSSPSCPSGGAAGAVLFCGLLAGAPGASPGSWPSPARGSRARISASGLPGVHEAHSAGVGLTQGPPLYLVCSVGARCWGWASNTPFQGEGEGTQFSPSSGVGVRGEAGGICLANGCWTQGDSVSLCP